MSNTSDDFDIEPDFDQGPSRLWLVELAFWRPSTLTDEEMESFFPDRDGRWSRQTKAAVLKHGARGLDLNQNWALSSGGPVRVGFDSARGDCGDRNGTGRACCGACRFIFAR